MKKILLGLLTLFIVWIVYLFLYNSPSNSHLVIAEKYEMAEIPKSILAVEDKSNPFKDKLEVIADNVPGHDDVILFEEKGIGFVTGMDGYFWKVDLNTKKAEQFVKTPLIPPGARRFPNSDNKIIFCASKLYGKTFPESEKVGLYELNIDTKEIKSVLQRVFAPPAITKNDSGKSGIVFTEENSPKLKLESMNEENSLPMAFCNDLAISQDGERIYFTSPYSYAGASMSGGTFGEAITLARNGLLWKYDLKAREVSLVAQDFNFIDGILIEDKENQKEESVLITETTKFKLDRFYVSGNKAGTHEVVWESLPGMPDGMDRDSKGRIWIGLVKKRSNLISWVHRNIWVKNVLLNLPKWMLPIPKQTGILCLSPDASTPLYYAMHDGSILHDIAVAIPSSKGVFLANFTESSRGLFLLAYPEALR